MSLPEQLRQLLALVSNTEAEEIDCDQFLERAAVLLEGLIGGHDLRGELATISQHLTVCPECREEFDALIRSLEG